MGLHSHAEVQHSWLPMSWVCFFNITSLTPTIGKGKQKIFFQNSDLTISISDDFRHQSSSQIHLKFCGSHSALYSLLWAFSSYFVSFFNLKKKKNCKIYFTVWPKEWLALQVFHEYELLFSFNHFLLWCGSIIYLFFLSFLVGLVWLDTNTIIMVVELS